MTEAERWSGLREGERPFRHSAWYYAEYRYRPSAAFVERLAGRLGWSTADRVLDLGAGPAHVSIRLAPFVGEVVVMDPEPAMLAEGRRRAAAAGVDNLAFVAGGSDVLARLLPDLGSLTAVVISQAFHWMRDQDAVLRALDLVLDRERGAVALVGYVNEPDFNRRWVGIDRPPWDAVERIFRRHVEGVAAPRHPAGRHDPFPDILARSSFSRTELVTYEHDTLVEPSIDAAIGFLYSLSGALERLGDRRASFEADVRRELAGADRSPFAVTFTDSALVGRRPEP